MSKKISSDPLLILRGFSAVAILLYHMQYPGVLIPPILGMDFHWITNSNGFVFVWIFFILSGYLIGKGFFTGRYVLTIKGLSRFYLYRFLKIAPLYYASLIFNWFAFRLFVIANPWFIFLKSLTFTANDQILQFGIDYLWFVSVLMQWYLMAPLVFFLIVKVFKKGIASGLILSVAVITVGTLVRFLSFKSNIPTIPGEYLYNLYSPTIFNLDFFIFGMLLSIIISHEKSSTLSAKNEHPYFFEKLPVIITLFLLLVYYILVSFFREQFMVNFAGDIFSQTLLLPVITMVVTGICIFVSENRKYSGYSKFTMKNLLPRDIMILRPDYFLQSIGLISFEFYIVHLPLMRIFNLTCYKTNGCSMIQFGTIFIQLFIITTICAWVIKNLTLRLQTVIIAKSPSTG